VCLRMVDEGVRCTGLTASSAVIYIHTNADIIYTFQTQWYI